MSSPPKDQPGASKDRPAPSSPESTPQQEPRAFTRAPPGGFGDRLALARRVRPEDVPPAPPRTAGPAPEVPSSSTLTAVWGLNNQPPAYKPRYGGTPGSYTSPYDIGGKTPGDPHLATSSTTWEAFEAKHGSGRHAVARNSATEASDASSPTATTGPSRRTITFGAMEPVNVLGETKAPAAAVSEQKVTPVIPEGVSTVTRTFSCI